MGYRVPLERQFLGTSAEVELRHILIAQIQLLRKGGVGERVIESLIEKEERAILTASMASIGEGNLPLMAVIPASVLSVMFQLQMTGKPVCLRYRPENFQDPAYVPEAPFWAIDVCIEPDLVGGCEIDAVTEVERRGRVALGPSGVTAFCLHGGAENLGRAMIASVSKTNGAAATFYYNRNGDICFSACARNLSLPNYGVLSRAKIVV